MPGESHRVDVVSERRYRKRIRRTDDLIAGAFDALGEPLSVVEDPVQEFHGGAARAM